MRINTPGLSKTGQGVELLVSGAFYGNKRVMSVDNLKFFLSFKFGSTTFFRAISFHFIKKKIKLTSKKTMELLNCTTVVLFDQIFARYLGNGYFLSLYFFLSLRTLPCTIITNRGANPYLGFVNGETHRKVAGKVGFHFSRCN